MSMMTLRHSVVVSFLCLVAGAASAAPARPVAPRRAAAPAAARPAAADEGGIRILPRIGIAATMDSNIFLTSANPTSSPYETQSAWIAEPSVALGIRARGRKSLLQAGYELTPRIYSHAQNANNAVHQTAALAAQIEYMPDGLIGLDDQFRVTTDPATSEETRRALRNQNDAGFMFDLPVGSKFYAGIRVTDTIHHYRQSSTDFSRSLSDLFDRNELAAALRLGLRPTPKTKAYGFYRNVSVNFKSASSYGDSTGSHVGAGIEGEITSRLTGIIEVNSMARSYKQAVAGEAAPTAAAGSTVTESSDYTTGGFTVSLKWEGPTGWSALVSGGRGFQESLFNRYSIQTGGTVAVTKELDKRFSVQVVGSYLADAYPNARSVAIQDPTAPGGTSLKYARRADGNLSVGLNLSYHLIERQTLKLGYLMRQRSSNFSVYKYSDNQITLSADYLL